MTLSHVRFDRSKPALPYNLVLCTREEAAAHDTATAITGSVHPLLLPRKEGSGGNADGGDGGMVSMMTGGKHEATLEQLLAVQAKLAHEESIWI